MRFDDRPDHAKRLEKARLSRGFKSIKDAATFFGWSYPTYAQHEQGVRGIGKVAARYARAFRVSEAWLLTGEGESPEEPKVPLMGIAAGSNTGQNIMHDIPIDYVSRPPALANVADAYAIWVRGVSMEPEYREGALCFVHPHKLPVKGDTVIIQQSVNGHIVAFIKELVSRDKDMVTASQHNPKARIDYPASQVLAVHKVLRINELFGI